MLKDRAKVSTTTEGTGVLTLGVADNGFQGFDSISGQTYYAITNKNQWEVGVGTYSSGLFSRDVVYDSSASGDLIDLSGKSTVFVTYPASKAVYLSPSANPASGDFLVRGNASWDSRSLASGDVFSAIGYIPPSAQKTYSAASGVALVGDTFITSGDGHFSSVAINSNALTSSGDALLWNGSAVTTGNFPTYTADSGISLNGNNFRLDGTGTLDQLKFRDFINLGNNTDVFPSNIYLGTDIGGTGTYAYRQSKNIFIGSGVAKSDFNGSDTYFTDSTLIGDGCGLAASSIISSQVIGPYAASYTKGKVMYSVVLGGSAAQQSSGVENSVVIGLNAAAYTVSGKLTNSVIIGHDSFSYVSGTPSNCTAIGYQAGYQSNGFYNSTFLGSTAGSNSRSSNDVAVGYGSMLRSSGTYNVAAGRSSFYQSTGTNNVAIGYQSYTNARQIRSVGVGTQSLGESSGNEVIAIGRYAGYYSTGINNVYIGSYAGYKTSGNRNIQIRVSGLESHWLNGEYSNKLLISDVIAGDLLSKRLAIGGLSSGSLSPNATLEIIPSLATDKTLIVKGASSHSANLVEAQDFGGNSLFSVAPDGLVSGVRFVSSGGIVVDSGIPAVTTNALYSSGQTLNWNGSPLPTVVSGVVSGIPYFSSLATISADSGLLYSPSGKFLQFMGTGVAANPIRMRILSDSTLSFEGNQGQLLSISDNLSSGTIFSVSDISGMSSLEVDASGLVKIAETDGVVGIGTSQTFGQYSGKMEMTYPSGYRGLIIRPSSGNFNNAIEIQNANSGVVFSVSPSGAISGALSPAIVQSTGLLLDNSFHGKIIEHTGVVSGVYTIGTITIPSWQCMIVNYGSGLTIASGSNTIRSYSGYVNINDLYGSASMYRRPNGEFFLYGGLS